MSRPLRDTDPSKVHLITIRCLQASLFMSPDKAVNETIGGLLAKYQTQFNITLYAYNFLSNHFHLIAQAPEGNLWRFMQGINREIAKRLNTYRNREGHFWARRYDDQEILREEDAFEALLYVSCNAVSHGLVSHPKSWPGVNSYQQLMDGKDRKYYYINHTKYRQAKLKALRTGKKVYLEDFKEEYFLRLTPLPGLSKYSHEKRREVLNKAIESRVQTLCGERRKEGKGFLGVAKILHQNPFSTPRNVKKSARPVCYTKCVEAMRRFVEELRVKLDWYNTASKKFRLGNLRAVFPPFCFKPPLLYCTK